MEFAPALQKAIRYMNDDQKKIVAHKHGPLLVIAGPGSGKTYSLIHLAMNLFLCEEADLSHMVLCTYTEKAAYELQDRLAAVAKDVHYTGDLSRLKIGTIHGICQQIINEHLSDTSLVDGYETLTQFTQQLFILEHLHTLCSDDMLACFRQRWGTPWGVAKNLALHFNTITEELIVEKLIADFPDLRPYPGWKEKLFCYLRHAYDRYRHALRNANCTDFAHLQKWTYNLLNKPATFEKITRNIRYVLVDEYQDTNYIQEKILTLLASPSNNLIVIGDEDQALYRFRGATVRNILTFTERFPDCSKVHLTINRRSHPGIIVVSNQWMTSFDWSNPGGNPLRTEKVMRPHGSHKDYPSVITLSTVAVEEEAEQFAELVATLKQHEKIDDYSDVALLLHSVRSYMSENYIQALAKRNIPVYCPRAGMFFAQLEIQLILGSFARILQYPRASRPQSGSFAEYLQECFEQLQKQCQKRPELEREFQAIEKDIALASRNGNTLPKQTLASYFYRLLFIDPFDSFQKDPTRRSFLKTISQHLATFQKHYHYGSVTSENFAAVGQALFDGFFFFLFQDDVHQDEDQQQPILKGHVQIMTIHQAKGLEFPVVVVGRLDALRTQKEEERDLLQDYYHQDSYEPPEHLFEYDLRRLYYVAFSRAKGLLVLTTAKKRQNPRFNSLWQSLPSWASLQPKLRDIPPLRRGREYLPPKPRYGFTTHIQTYLTCPRRYQFFYEHRFAPSNSADVFFGRLVHQTIEQIHRQALDRPNESFDEQQIRKLFEKTHYYLQSTQKRSMSVGEKDSAFHQVLNYVQHNRQEMQNIKAAECAIQIERGNYVLGGKIDVLREGEKGEEVLDFKTRPRPDPENRQLRVYQQQLYLYAYALHQRTGHYPSRLLLYWTGEERKADALMEVPCHAEVVEEAVASVHKTVMKIQEQQFEVRTLPSANICRGCDIRRLCQKERLLPRQI